MTDEAQRWKEKYLQSIEAQESQERRWSARLDLLRHGLVRSTLAAEGADTAVDQCMKEMREVVRSDNMDAALANLIPRLEKAVLDSEQRREARLDQIGTALGSLVAQLQTLPLPRDAAKPLKKFGAGLDKRLSQVRELPLLLSELSLLQGNALASLDPATASRPGLLERLFGHREAEPAHAIVNTEAAPVPLLAPEEAPAPIPEPLEAAPSPAHGEPAHEDISLQAVGTKATHPVPAEAEADVSESEVQPEAANAEEQQGLPPVPQPAAEALAPHAVPEQEGPVTAAVQAVLDVLPLTAAMVQALVPTTEPAEATDASFSLPASQEPTYSSVATHIESTLLKMLDGLVLPPKLLETADSMRERLEHGLNWYELLPMLDDVALMTLTISDNGQQELQRYLQQINERLAWFQGQLHEASQGQADSQDQARQLDTELREQVGDLHESVAAVEDADALKRLLESRLDGLLGSVDEHRRRREAHEVEVAERMRGLSDRVASMEREAEAYQSVLEEQRQKALQDPLTGLPNRAGLNERLEALISQRATEEVPAQVAIMDLDHFKSINDNYGHLAGDRVLKIVADQLRRQLRDGDFLARFGGEEFVALFPGSAPEEAHAVLEQMRQAIEACPFHFKGMRIVVTVSMGMATLRSKEAAQAALKRADEALYRAKDTGRNRIETSQVVGLARHVD
ncbi:MULTISPECIES: GGDEF domain-containing protein [Pseudomonas]|uniref:diguanylate cyclase n=1 Tax=Pseudomonas quercus TaxID=2722792 RepID=A0ABX0YM43_9PSED|nr:MULTISPECIES: GGDEF domain-containing protein [Pseudomonas]MBF7144454.1 diguanylate cyclase [Pseudomonas sp. LY10J]NJP02993.1 diguanylate cyclase [Pseudomonas quercus]